MLTFQKCVSVGINTEPDTSTAEEDSSECVTIIGRDASCDTGMCDLTPTEPVPETFTVMEKDISEDKDDVDTSDEVRPLSRVTEECQVEVHLTNGHLAGSKPHLVKTHNHELNGHLSDSDKDCDTEDTNYNYKKPLLIDQIREHIASPGSPWRTQCSCSSTMADSILAKLRLRARTESLLSMSESPDIFHLRAPLVSMENMVTPSNSEDSLLAAEF